MGSALGLGAFLSACGGVKTSGDGDDGSDFPSQAIEMGVGFAAGGSTDLIARASAKELEKILGVSLPVINTPGANGSVMGQELSSAKPDGYSIGCFTSSTFTVTPFAVPEDEALNTDMYETIKGYTQDDYVLVTHPDNGWATMEDVANAGKAINYGTTSFGSGAHLAAAIAFSSLGIDATDVPYEGDAPSMTAAMGKQVDISANALSAVYENIKGGALVPLVVFSEKPHEMIPDVKTAQDQNIDFVLSLWRVLAAPKDTPSEVVKKLSEACDEAFATDEFKQFCADQTLLADVWEPDEIKKMCDESKETYGKQMEEHGISFNAN